MAGASTLSPKKVRISLKFSIVYIQHSFYYLQVTFRHLGGAVPSLCRKHDRRDVPLSCLIHLADTIDGVVTSFSLRIHLADMVDETRLVKHSFQTHSTRQRGAVPSFSRRKHNLLDKEGPPPFLRRRKHAIPVKPVKPVETLTSTREKPYS